MPSRRDFLKGTLAGSTLAMFPPSIQKALAIPANHKTGTIQDVEHVVILMQENRSFDNYFGTLKGVRGFGDRFTIPLSDNRTVWEQYNAIKQKILPYHLNQTKGNAQRVSMTPHTWTDARDAWDKGRMHEWVKHKISYAVGNESMGYFTEQELPFHYALADAFTVCDAYYSSLHGGTNTNRLFHWTGTNGASAGEKVVVNNHWDKLGSSNEGFNWTTYPERLETAGVSWKVYQNLPDNFTDNPLAGFKKYRKAYENSGLGKPFNQHAPYTDAINASEPLAKGVANTMPDGGLLGAFKEDINNNTLPQVSWLIAPEAYCEHPGPSSPVQGSWYIQEVLNALTNNPDVWSKTVFIINFDENDGYFDHLPPPCPPSLDDKDEFIGKTTLSKDQMGTEYYTHPTESGMPANDKDVYGPGPRVPMLIISPWSRGGWVNSQAFDHTSVLRFLEARFGVEETNISPFRKAIFGDLCSAFNFKNPNFEPVAVSSFNGVTTKDAADALRNQQTWKFPPPQEANRGTPQQTLGTRPSHALPYELHTSARTDKTQNQVQLLFSNTGQVGAVFQVYDKKHLDAIPRRYVVEAGKQLDDIWTIPSTDAGEYDLWVLGPNGFHRHFKGNLGSANTTDTAQPEIQVCYDPCASQLHVTVTNHSRNTVDFTLKDLAYFKLASWQMTLPTGQSQTQIWSLPATAPWYDFIITCSLDDKWSRRFAGRMETGQHCTTDPVMGM